MNDNKTCNTNTPTHLEETGEILDQSEIYGELFSDVPEPIRILMAVELLEACPSVDIETIHSMLHEQLEEGKELQCEFDWDNAI